MNKTLLALTLGILLTGVPAAFADHGPDHFEQMATAVGLNAQQKASARKIHDETMAKAAPLMEQARKQHEAIEAVLESANPDPTDVGRKVIAMYAVHKQLKALHEGAMNRIKTQLTAEQRAKLDKLHAEHAGPMGHGFMPH